MDDSFPIPSACSWVTSRHEFQQAFTHALAHNAADIDRKPSTLPKYDESICNQLSSLATRAFVSPNYVSKHCLYLLMPPRRSIHLSSLPSPSLLENILPWTRPHCLFKHPAQHLNTVDPQLLAAAFIPILRPYGSFLSFPVWVQQETNGPLPPALADSLSNPR